MDRGGWIAILVALITTAGVIGSKYLEVGGRTPAKTAADSAASITMPPAVLQLAGAWRDQFASRFMIAVDQDRFTLSGANGDKIMSGAGRVVGDAMTLAITNTSDAGTIRCAGPVGTATLVTLTCSEPDGSQFEWRLTR